MVGLRSHVQLRRLMRDRVNSVSAEIQVAVPLLPSFACAQIIEGVAASTAVDRDDMQLAPKCFGELTKYEGRVCLLHEHDPTQTAGDITSLYYDDQGQLHMRATVEHVTARRCNALSVGFRALDFKHVGNIIRILRAELTEISTVQYPRNSACIITSRCEAPSHEFHLAMRRRLARVRELILQLPARQAA